jgi:hypothetical protein
MFAQRDMRGAASGENPDMHRWRAAPSAVTLFYNVPVTIGVKPL